MTLNQNQSTAIAYNIMYLAYSQLTYKVFNLLNINHHISLSRHRIGVSYLGVGTLSLKEIEVHICIQARRHIIEYSINQSIKTAAGSGTEPK